MSSEIWNIGQYDKNNIDNSSIELRIGIVSTSINSFGISRLTEVCNQMSEDFKSLEQDQIEYALEFDSFEEDYNNTIKDINDSIKETASKIQTLYGKEQNGTISEDEKKELENLKSNFKELMLQSDKQKNEAAQKRNETKTKAQEKYGAKERRASEYGNAAVEKGTLFAAANTEEGSWIEKQIKKTMKPLGEAAVEAGNGLLDKLNNSRRIFNNKN